MYLIQKQMHTGRDKIRGGTKKNLRMFVIKCMLAIVPKNRSDRLIDQYSQNPAQIEASGAVRIIS